MVINGKRLLAEKFKENEEIFKSLGIRDSSSRVIVPLDPFEKIYSTLFAVIVLGTNVTGVSDHLMSSLIIRIKLLAWVWSSAKRLSWLRVCKKEIEMAEMRSNIAVTMVRDRRTSIKVNP